MARVDVVQAVLGVSAALAGFTLVLLGLLVTTLQSFGGSTPKSVLERYRRVVEVVGLAFGAGLMATALGAAWLVEGGSNRGIYAATLSATTLQLVTLGVATVWVLRRLVWEK